MEYYIKFSESLENCELQGTENVKRQMEAIVFIILSKYFQTRAVLKIAQQLKIRPVVRKGYGSIAHA